MPANDKRPVKVNKRSGYDKHFRNSLTGKCGTLVPILFDEVIPDTKVNLKINLATALPPLVSDTYMNVRLRVEAFAVPLRLCFGSFEDFFNDFPRTIINKIQADSTDGLEITSSDYSACCPIANIGGTAGYDGEASWIAYIAKYFGAKSSLCDYLGMNIVPEMDTEECYINPLPFVAYHLIWQEWYRNPRVQKPAFAPRYHTVADNDYSDLIDFGIIASLPYDYCAFSGDHQYQINPFIDDGMEDTKFAPEAFDTLDGESVFELRQRNFGLDYFTAALVEPQQGPKAIVVIDDDTNPEGSFSIASLRAMNSLQQWRERNMLTSPRYQQQIFARYGVAPSDGVIQRPVLLGAATYDVYSHGITQAANNEVGATGTTNPFGKYLGARGGNAFAGGSDFIIRGFHAKEPMYIMVLASLVPEVSYSQNLNMAFTRYIGKGSISDMANGILQNVGPEPIENRQLVANSNDTHIFAYTDRYSSWMFKQNEIHGEFRHDGTLHNFVLQRLFDPTDIPDYGSEFLTIPTDYMDDVLVATTASMGLTYWMDCLMEYSVSMPLQEYAIPSLQDPGYEHGRTITLRKNGQLL